MYVVYIKNTYIIKRSQKIHNQAKVHVPNFQNSKPVFRVNNTNIVLIRIGYPYKDNDCLLLVHILFMICPYELSLIARDNP